MNRSRTNLAQLLRTASWKKTTNIWRFVPLVGVMSVALSGCADTQNPKHLHAVHHTPNMSFQPLPTLSAPNQVVIQGQQNALTHFMARKWRLKSINHIPAGKEVVIDLTDFTKAQGYAYTDCDEIFFELDTTKVLTSKLATLNLERKMSDCTHSLGDDIMRILGDLHSFSHKNNVLTLISLKDKIELIPLS